MTLLPMNRLYDELYKMEQHRKKETSCVTFIQQEDFDWFEQEEKNLNLNLLLAEARTKPIDYKMNITDYEIHQTPPSAKWWGSFWLSVALFAPFVKPMFE